MTDTENGSHAGVLEKSNWDSEARRYTDLDSRATLAKRLIRGPSARIRFVDSHIAKGIAFQIQSLRSKKKWTQEKLADRLGSNQNSVYRLENPNYGKQTLTTLKKVAAAFDVALIVRFVPFTQLIDWVRGAPYLDPGLSEDTLIVPSFDEELRLERFNEASNDHHSAEPRKAIGITEAMSGRKPNRDPIWESLQGGQRESSPVGHGTEISETGGAAYAALSSASG